MIIHDQLDSRRGSQNEVAPSIVVNVESLKVCWAASNPPKLRLCFSLVVSKQFIVIHDSRTVIVLHGQVCFVVIRDKLKNSGIDRAAAHERTVDATIAEAGRAHMT